MPESLISQGLRVLHEQEAAQRQASKQARSQGRRLRKQQARARARAHARLDQPAGPASARVLVRSGPGALKVQTSAKPAARPNPAARFLGRHLKAVKRRSLPGVSKFSKKI